MIISQMQIENGEGSLTMGYYENIDNGYKKIIKIEIIYRYIILPIN
jgi:hypothetical protein